MKRTIVEEIGALVDRRLFLRRISLVAGSFAAGVLGLPKSSEASDCSTGNKHGCCCLCKNPYVSCPYDWVDWGDPGNCSFVWQWYCNTGFPGWHTYFCYECFGTCTNVTDPQPPPLICNSPQTMCTGHCCTDVRCSHFIQVN
jgi:hypothetical protein